MKQPLVIIGSGLAGYMLAKEWRKLEKNQSLIIITLDDGNFYSKPLLSTALTNQKTPQQLVVTDAKKMAEQLDATIYTYARVTAIDPKAHIVHYQYNGDEFSLEYDRLVFACGAKKLVPRIEGNAINQIQSVNSLEDYGRFREWLQDKNHIAIMGTGLVGCEFANDLINAGYQVDIISPDSFPLAKVVPDSIGEQINQQLQEKGVRWYLNRMVTAVNRDENDGYQVTLSNNSLLRVDGVFCAIGIRPNIDIAKASGVKTNNGIVVNRELKTNYSNIFALGDCAEVDGMVKQYVAPILHCARVLAKNLMGDNVSVQYPIMPIVVKTPACPVVTFPPPHGVGGQWRIDGSGKHMQALFHDETGQLRGFSLIGDKVREKMAIIKRLPVMAES